MNIEIHEIGNIKIVEIKSEDIIIHNAEDGSQLLADLYYQDFARIILHEKNINSDFFDLKTKIAGELLQKVSNFRLQLVLVGEFEKYPGKSIKDFITESNRGKQVNFLGTVEAAIAKLSVY